MAYNQLSGTVIAPEYFGPAGDEPGTNIISGNLSTSDGSNIINVPRVSNAVSNGIVIDTGGNANTLRCDSSLNIRWYKIKRCRTVYR